MQILIVFWTLHFCCRPNLCVILLQVIKGGADCNDFSDDVAGDCWLIGGNLQACQSGVECCVNWVVWGDLALVSLTGFAGAADSGL